jgi:4-amino-4-deoxy-L-arabinose transferase-like glycosyltransferase
MMRNEKLGLTVLFLISLLLSICLFFRTYVISMDGAFQYIPLAKDFSSGHFGKALGHNQQPLFPFMLAYVSRWVPDFEVAGKLVSSLFGILLMIPVYFLGKMIFDKKIAFLSSLFLVIHPSIREFSADVLKESTYLFFLGTALWLSWKAIQEERRYFFLFIPFFSVLAYLVRPDGFEVILLVFFYIFFAKAFATPSRKKEALFLLFSASMILLLPYLFYLREVKGEWAFGKAKSVIEMVGLGTVGDTVPLIQKVSYSLKRLSLEIFWKFHPVYIFLLAVGLVKRLFSGLKTGEGFLLCFCGLHYGVLFLMVLNTTQWSGDGTVLGDNLSGRHVLPLLLISIYWIGDGFMMSYRLISKKLESHLHWIHPDPIKRSPLILVMLCILVSALVLPKTLKSIRYQRLPEKWAGTWIKNQYGKGMNIFTTLPRVVYYADGEGEYIDIRKNTLENIESSMVKKKALFLVIREDEIVDFSGNAEALKKDFIELIRFEGEGMEKIVLYKTVQ